MEAVPEYPEGDEEGEQETAFGAAEKPATSEQEPLKRKISSTTTSKASGSTSSAPLDGRRRSRKGSIFVAEEPYADCLSGYVPEEPEEDDDVFVAK